MPSRVSLFLCGALIVAAGLAAYANSFHGPFVFDDPSSIVANPTIRHLWPPWAPLATPRVSVTVEGRPILNLSFAINYALGGTKVIGYHIGNIVIHLAAALTLFGIVRRTVKRLLPALAAALLWSLHPLQTEAVSYVVQRAESLMGLFYLLTLYAFIRSTDGPARWSGLSVGFCLLGMGTKEVMVSAPLIVLLYDRAFAAGTFAEAFKLRGKYYLSLAATWILLVGLIVHGGGNRGGSVGFGVHVHWWSYVLTQFHAIAVYLRLAFWPHPLVFEYGIYWVHHAAEVLLPAALVLPLAAISLVALRHWPAWGLLGFAFFAVLAPTSLVPGTSQMIVEHRMYLALAPLVVAIVMAADAGIGRFSPQFEPALFAGFFCAAAVLGGLTFQRNRIYRSEESVWLDTLAKRPNNALAHSMLAHVYDSEGRTREALAEYTRSAELDPTFALAQESIGEMLFKLGRRDEAIPHYEEALRIWPAYADAHDNLGVALADAGDVADAMALFRETLKIDPDYTEAHYNLANMLAATGRRDEAIQEYAATLRLRPDYARAEFNLANTLLDLNRTAEAVAHYAAALRIQPDFPAAQYNWANAAALSGHPAEALPHYAEAVRLKPDYAEAEGNWGGALVELGRYDEAIPHLQAALRLNPKLPEARIMLERLNSYRAQHPR